MTKTATVTGTNVKMDGFQWIATAAGCRMAPRSCCGSGACRLRWSFVAAGARFGLPQGLRVFGRTAMGWLADRIGSPTGTLVLLCLSGVTRVAWLRRPGHSAEQDCSGSREQNRSLHATAQDAAHIAGPSLRRLPTRLLHLTNK